MSTILTHFNRWYISSFEEERHVFIYVTGVPMRLLSKCNYSDVKPWMYCLLIHMRKRECRKAFHYMSWAVESVATVCAICDVTNSLHMFWKLVGIHVLQNCECQCVWRVNKFVFNSIFVFQWTTGNMSTNGYHCNYSVNCLWYDSETFSGQIWHFYCFRDHDTQTVEESCDLRWIIIQMKILQRCAE